LTGSVRGQTIARMRTVTALTVTVLALATLAPGLPRADEPVTIELEVGEAKSVGGYRPLCDDPSIAWFSDDGKGELKGLKVGTTTCSVSRGSALGTRQVYRVVVSPPTKKGGGGATGKGPGEG
jgi:hypothetical protein